VIQAAIVKNWREYSRVEYLRPIISKNAQSCPSLSASLCSKGWVLGYGSVLRQRQGAFLEGALIPHPVGVLLGQLGKRLAKLKR